MLKIEHDATEGICTVFWLAKNGKEIKTEKS
jgi:hypothetical protein